MKAGFAEADITPKLPCPIGGYGDYVAEELLSRLFARALYVEGPDAAWAICSCDLIGLDRAEICLPVMDRCGRAASTAASPHRDPHAQRPAHAVPDPTMNVKRRDDAYIERVKKAIVDIILLARDTASPAEVGFGRAFAGENINRRVNLEDGSHYYLPEHKELYQYATGPTDEELGVVAFREIVTGFPIVTLVNYTAHALTIGNYKWVVTADYPGVAHRRPRAAHRRRHHVHPGRLRRRPPLRLRDRPRPHAPDGRSARGAGPTRSSPASPGTPPTPPSPGSARTSTSPCRSACTNSHETGRRAGATSTPFTPT